MSEGADDRVSPRIGGVGQPDGPSGSRAGPAIRWRISPDFSAAAGELSNSPGQACWTRKAPQTTIA
jgi:hypothetical protein